MREARASDLADALGLLDRELAGSTLAGRAREVCARAVGAADDREHRALVADRGGAAGLAGVVLFGAWAGTVGGARLHALAGSDDARAALLEAARASCRASGARYLIAELADEPALRPTLDALRRAGFAEEARVADLVADGVDLVVLARPLSRG